MAAVERIDWEDLPAQTRQAVEKHTGYVRAARTVPAGQNSAVAAVLATETGTVFVKGLHRDHPRRWNQGMEAMINPHIAHLSPRLLWHIEDEWDLLGFELVNGRHVVYRPGSADLVKVTRTMAALGELECPDLPVKRAEQRWREYADSPDELRWLTGNQLLHTDFNRHNVLISNGRALLIDWARPTRGAGWIDPACLILRLMAYGHSAASAQQVVADLPAWQRVSEEGLAVFARVCARIWVQIAGHNPIERTQRMARVAAEWARECRTP